MTRNIRGQKNGSVRSGRREALPSRKTEGGFFKKYINSLLRASVAPNGEVIVSLLEDKHAIKSWVF